MANKRINDLPAITGDNVAPTDVLPIVDQSAYSTKKITFDELKTAITKDSQPTLPAGLDGQVLSLQEGVLTWVDFSPEGIIVNIGPSDQDNSWRFILKPNGLELQVRKLGDWVKRGFWTND